MVALCDRIGTAVSSAELERRWSAARRGMAAAGLDALLIHGTNDYLGGYVRWFSDIPATTGYPTTIVFPAIGDMRIVSQGRFGLESADCAQCPGGRVGTLSHEKGYRPRRPNSLQRLTHQLPFAAAEVKFPGAT